MQDIFGGERYHGHLGKTKSFYHRWKMAKAILTTRAYNGLFNKTKAECPRKKPKAYQLPVLWKEKTKDSPKTSPIRSLFPPPPPNVTNPFFRFLMAFYRQGAREPSRELHD